MKRNLFLAFSLAPIAGAVAAGITATIVAAPWRLGLGPWQDQVSDSLPRRIGATLYIGVLTAIAAYVIALACTAICGGIAVARHRKRGRTSPRTVIGCGVLIGVTPVAVAVFPSLLGERSELTTNGGPDVGTSPLRLSRRGCFVRDCMDLLATRAPRSGTRETAD
jgi:ABC-type spermidine/putrescine transport system permease subunit II